jgi:hypothetical protein
LHYWNYRLTPSRREGRAKPLQFEKPVN